MDFLKDLLNGTEKTAEINDNTADDKIVENFKSNDLAKAVLAAEEKIEGLPVEANLTALIDEDRVKHIEGMSDTNLAQLYTEMSLYDEGKSVMTYFAEEFKKNLESVKSNRKSIETKILALVPKHNISKKANAINIWSVNGDNLVRIVGDPFADVIDASKTAFTLLTDLGVVKIGDEVELDGALGTVSSFHPSNFNNKNIGVKFSDGEKLVSLASLKKNSVDSVEKTPTQPEPSDQEKIKDVQTATGQIAPIAISKPYLERGLGKSYVLYIDVQFKDLASAKSAIPYIAESLGASEVVKAFANGKPEVLLSEQINTLHVGIDFNFAEEAVDCFESVHENDYAAFSKFVTSVFPFSPPAVKASKTASEDVLIIREAPALAVLPKGNPMKENPMELVPAVHTAQPGEINLVDPIKIAIPPTDDSTFQGAPQTLDNPEDKIPAVYRNPDTVPNPTKTKDFGHFQNHAALEPDGTCSPEMAYFNQENAQKYNKRKVTDNHGEITSTSPSGCMVKLPDETVVYVHSNDVVSQEKIASLRGLFKKAETVQYVDKATKTVVPSPANPTPETAVSLPIATAPDTVTSADGKELIKQKVDKPITAAKQDELTDDEIEKLSEIGSYLNEEYNKVDSRLDKVQMEEGDKAFRNALREEAVKKFGDCVSRYTNDELYDSWFSYEPQ